MKWASFSLKITINEKKQSFTDFTFHANGEKCDHVHARFTEILVTTFCELATLSNLDIIIFHRVILPLVGLMDESVKIRFSSEKKPKSFVLMK